MTHKRLLILVLVMILAGCGASSQTATTPTAVPPVETTADEIETETAAPDSTEETINILARCTKLNLNDVTGDTLLATIPDFSSRMVREFEEYRPYVSIQQFRREIGKYVDTAQVAEYEQYVYVPVSPNDSDADTLQQMPGVDDALAEMLIAERPYASNEAFINRLSGSLNAEQLAEAICYLVEA
jgi:radical SAM superfamily enzyme with C-terminal helix-hairpin-helix motif